MKKLNAVCAVYAIGAVWLLGGLLFPIYKLSTMLMVAGISLIVYFVFNQFLCEKKEEVVKFVKTGVAEADEIVKKGQGFVKKLDELNGRISNAVLNGQIENLKKMANDIFLFISKNPENGRQLDNFMDYYFPATIKLLESYAEMSGLKSGNKAKTMASIESVMENIEKAFEKQLDMLYESKNLDISSDIDVLKTILRRENLE